MDKIEEILRRSKVVAVVGASADPTKPANSVPRSLKEAGYRIIPVNPKGGEILGEQVYERLADIPEPVDVVDVFRPPREAPEVARQAVAIGAKTFWLQLGLVSAEARKIAEEGGLDYIEDACMAIEIHKYGITKSTGPS